MARSRKPTASAPTDSAAPAPSRAESKPALPRAEGLPAHALVGVIMGSQSDWETMQHAVALLEAFSIPHECRIVSAHRTPQRLVSYATSARERGLEYLIAGAGGAAHLPGMTAALSPLPVFGVPVESKSLKGLDSLLSIAQMPGGVPVGTLAIGAAGAKNAALLAIACLANHYTGLRAALDAYRAQQSASVELEPRRTAPRAAADARAANARSRAR